MERFNPGSLEEITIFAEKLGMSEGLSCRGGRMYIERLFCEGKGGILIREEKLALGKASGGVGRGIKGDDLSVGTIELSIRDPRGGGTRMRKDWRR